MAPADAQAIAERVATLFPAQPKPLPASPQTNVIDLAAERGRRRGPGALNQEAGFASPLVLDDDRSITELFGVGGTPAAVLIDAQGIVATPVARGATGVRSLLDASRVTLASRQPMNADAAD